MKKIYLVLFIYYLCICCTPKRGVEIEMINDTINSLHLDSNKTNTFISDSLYRKKGKNIIRYKITNHDSKIYYFNLKMNSYFSKNIIGIGINKGFINFFDKHNVNVKTIGFLPSKFTECKDSFWEYQNKILEELSYEMSGIEKYYYETANFVIHPNETLYFEDYVYLPIDGITKFHNAKFNYQNEYSAEIIIYSDSTNYKKNISRGTLQTIKQNRYEVYHGILKSKNKVPVKFVD